MNDRDYFPERRKPPATRPPEDTETMAQAIARINEEPK